MFNKLLCYVSSNFIDLDIFNFVSSSHHMHMQFQQRRVDEFCSKYDLTDTSYQISAKTNLGTHLLVDKEAKSMFCYVPKVAALLYIEAN